MIIKVTSYVGNIRVTQPVAHVFRVANFEIQADRIKASIGEEAGNLTVFDGLNWIVVDAPTADNQHLVSDTGLTGKMKWENQAAASGGVTSGPQAFADNYIITPSIASGNLTVALKTVAGADPTSNDKITVRIGNTKREITAAISVIKNAGTNWLNCGSAELAAKPVDFFVYLIQETGASAGTKIGFARISHARTMGDFVNTTTNERYIAGNWTNFNTTDEVEVIGRFRAQLSAGAGYTWSIPTAVVINRPIYETDWLEWTPTYTGFSSAPSGGSYRYQVQYGVARFMTNQTTTGTSNSTGLTITIPWTTKNLAGAYWTSACQVMDNGAVKAGLGLVGCAPNVNVLTCYPDGTGGNWTASGAKNVYRLIPSVTVEI